MLALLLCDIHNQNNSLTEEINKTGKGRKGNHGGELESISHNLALIMRFVILMDSTPSAINLLQHDICLFKNTLECAAITRLLVNYD